MTTPRRTDINPVPSEPDEEELDFSALVHEFVRTHHARVRAQAAERSQAAIEAEAQHEPS